MAGDRVLDGDVRRLSVVEEGDFHGRAAVVLVLAQGVIENTADSCHLAAKRYSEV